MSIPELKSLPLEERRRVLLAIGPGVYKNPIVWGAWGAQIIGFILIFYVFFPTAQPRLLLILAYVIPTVWMANRLHQRVLRERVTSFLKSKPPA